MPVTEKEFIGGYMPPDLAERIRQCAEREHRSVSNWLRRKLPRLVKEEEEQQHDNSQVPRK